MPSAMPFGATKLVVFRPWWLGPCHSVHVWPPTTTPFCLGNIPAGWKLCGSRYQIIRNSSASVAWPLLLNQTSNETLYSSVFGVPPEDQPMHVGMLVMLLATLGSG